MTRSRFEGRYRVLRVLGEGEVGRVYRALQVSVARAVAIKVFHDELARDAMLARRVLRDAHALASFTHPNIAHLYDYGRTEAGGLYLVMELLHGNTLAAELAMVDRIAPRRACEIACQISGALAAAHARSVAHGGLRPHNVFLVLDTKVRDDVRLVDFAIGKSQRSPPGDVYALGMLLYQMLAGGPPPRRPLPARLPSRLVALLDTLLARPRHRAADVQAELRDLLDRTPAVAPREERATLRELM